MGRFLRGQTLLIDEVHISAVSPGADVMDGTLVKRAAMADPNLLRPIADAADGEPSIQHDAAMDTVLTRGDRIFPQQQQQQQQYRTRCCVVDSIRMQYATAACRTTKRSAHDTGSEQQQTGQNT